MNNVTRDVTVVNGITWDGTIEAKKVVLWRISK